MIRGPSFGHLLIVSIATALILGVPRAVGITGTTWKGGTNFRPFLTLGLFNTTYPFKALLLQEGHKLFRTNVPIAREINLQNEVTVVRNAVPPVSSE